MYEDLFLPSHRWLTPPIRETPCDIKAIYTSLKSTFSGIPSLTIRVYLHSFSSYCLLNTRNYKRIWPYSSSRSSKVIDLGVNGKPICDFLLVINCNFSRICYTVFEIFTLKDRKMLILPTPPLFDAPARGEPLRISGWNLPHKNWRMGLPYGENFIILTSTVFYDLPVWQTDRRTGDSIQRAKHICYMLSRSKN